MSKLIYAKTRAGFETAYPDKTSIDKSIAFIEDGYIWTHGKYFRIFNDANPLLTSSVNGSTVTLNDANGQPILSFDRGIHKVTVTSPIIATTTDGSVEIKHLEPFTVNQLAGPTANSSSTINVPQITFDKSGHYVSVTNRVATLNQVLQTNVDTDATKHYLVGSTSSATSTSALNKTSKISFVPSTGTFDALVILEGGTALSGKYAPLSHVDVIANETTSGHVKLSDATDSTSGVLQGVAATPAAVKAVYDYARNIIAAGDAMIFKGIIGADGVITGVGDINNKTLATLETYSPGWTFRVSTAQTITGIGTLEVGDMVIAIKQKSGAYSADDFTVIQTNIDGAITAIENLIEDQLILGSTNTGIKTLTPGSNGQFLTIVNGKPSWTTASNTFRALFVDGTERLANNILDPLKLKSGTGITLSWNTTNKDVTISTSLQNLIIQNNGAAIGNYNPAGTTNHTLNAGSGLSASLSSNVFTINHSNTVTAQPVKAVRSFSYDAHGHITDSDVVTSLPTANPITFSDAKTTPTTKTFNGSTPLTVKFSPASGDINIVANTTTTNTIEYVLSLTHRYRPVSYVPAFNGTATSILSNSSNAALTLAPGNANVSLSWESNQLKISSVNTWRNVSAYGTNNTLSEVLSSSIGTDDLQFGSEFLWDNTEKEVKIGWAEISATGAITYVF